MTTNKFKVFLLELGFSFDDFDIFESPGCVAIIVKKWVWWWERKKLAKSTNNIRPIGISIRWYFCKKFYV